MLYQLFDWQRASLEPWRQLAQLGNDFCSHPQNPWALLPASRNMAAAFDLMGRLTRQYHRPEFGIDAVEVAGRRCAVREEFVLDKPFCRLLRFAKPGAPAQPRVIVFAPLSGHHATLLRETVRVLLADHEVWITDWIDAKEIPVSEGPFHFDDYVATVREFIAFLGAKDLHAISVCQPTVPVLAAVSLMAAAGEPIPRTLTMMGGPIDTRRSPTAVNDFARLRPLAWFESKVIQRVPMRYPGYMRRVYPGFMQFAGFIAMNPDRHVDSHIQYYQHLVTGDGESAEAHRRFYDEYNAVMDLPAEYYLETVERVFQEHALPLGRMEVAGERVRPEAIRDTALLTIEGELDDISGNGQTQAAHKLCRGIPAARRAHFLAPGVGHYGIFSGRKYREVVYPRLRAFIAANS